MTLKEAARELRALVGKPVHCSIDVAAVLYSTDDEPTITWKAYCDGPGYVATAPSLDELMRLCRAVITPALFSPSPDADAAVIDPEGGQTPPAPAPADDGPWF